jgi:hypothetical protein
MKNDIRLASINYSPLFQWNDEHLKLDNPNLGPSIDLTNES